jgi:integrase
VARTLKRLSARKVANAKVPKGRTRLMLCDGGGLYLKVAASASGGVSKCWVFRYEQDHKRAEVGLGAVADVTLAEARDKARQYRKQLVDGINPLTAKREAVAQRRLAAAKSPMTFGQATDRFLQTHEVAWRNGVHRKQWRSTLATYCAPINDLPVEAIDTALVLKVLVPVWSSKVETGRRLRARIERILSWAQAHGFRNGDNPARWPRHLSEMLPAPSKVAKIKHFAALPYKQIGDFMAELRSRESADSAQCLELTILCATRTSETLGMLWDEIDFGRKLWTVPASRTKTAREHIIPLSDRAVAILKKRQRHHHGDRVFDLSNMAMLKLLRGLHPTATTHGFRSTFRDWAGNETNTPREVCEQALSHLVGDKAEQAYRRDTAIEKRRRLMDSWSRYCERPSVKAKANVVPMRRTGATP